MSSLEFDQWNDAGGNPVMRISGGELQVWNGSAWVAAGVAPLANSNVTGTTGSPTITTDGSAYIYSYTGSGSITLDQGGTCDILLVGGGGAGATAGGGGGAGGCLYLQSAYLPAGTHTITVGAGGVVFAVPTNYYAMPGLSGTSSSVGGLYTAVGGGGGAARLYRYNTTSEGTYAGNTGGSGGGAASTTSGSDINKIGGAGIPGQGNDGGDAYFGAYYSPGGGGAGAAGGDATSSAGGDGGNGQSISITGSAVTYAGGGGGCGYAATNPGAGGTGGGGAGGNTTATDGTDGLGGGGGGCYAATTGSKGGDGGSGIVIVRVGG